MNTISFLDVIWYLFLWQIAIRDWKERKIPKSYVWAIFFCGVFRRLCMEKAAIVEGIAGMGIAFLLFFLILWIAPGSFGGGDIKLSVANGCYLGLECWIESFIIAVFVAAFWILYGRICKKKREEKEIAFGPFLCLGAFLAKIM